MNWRDVQTFMAGLLAGQLIQLSISMALAEPTDLTIRSPNMIDWLQSWSMATWAFAIGAVCAVFVVAGLVVGRETLTRWVEAVWKKRTT